MAEKENWHDLYLKFSIALLHSSFQKWVENERRDRMGMKSSLTEREKEKEKDRAKLKSTLIAFRALARKQSHYIL